MKLFKLSEQKNKNNPLTKVYQQSVDILESIVENFLTAGIIDLSDNSYTVLKDMTHKTQMNARQNQIDYRFSISFEGIIAKIDHVRVEEILANVVSNAIKYTPSGGKVFVETEVKQRQTKDGKNYELNVTEQDTGIGMSSDFLPYIFDIISRERTNYSHQIQGTGLGMGIKKNFWILWVEKSE